jgi:hypothetical protein
MRKIADELIMEVEMRLSPQIKPREMHGSHLHIHQCHPQIGALNDILISEQERVMRFFCIFSALKYCLQYFVYKVLN